MRNEFDLDYSLLIKAYRNINYLTQEDFAKLIGVSFATVNRWENKHFMPTIKMKKKLDSLFSEAGMLKERKVKF